MSTAIPTTQKALILHAQGEPFVVGTVEVEQPRPGEVLVREESVALNPVDWIMQQTGLYEPPYPAIFGWDAAGVVVQLGEGVTTLAVGDKVYVPEFRQGSSTRLTTWTTVCIPGHLVTGSPRTSSTVSCPLISSRRYVLVPFRCRPSWSSLLMTRLPGS